MNAATGLVFMFACVVTSSARSAYLSNFEECNPTSIVYSKYICGQVERNYPGIRTQIAWGHNVHDSDNFRLDSTLSASQQTKPKGPYTVGGALDLTHKPTGSEANVKVQHTKGGGNDVGVGATYNFFQHGDTSVKATAEATQHFGGPGGSTKPDYQVGIQLESQI